MTLFDDPGAKLNRANEHLKTLYDKLRIGLNEHGDMLKCEIHLQEEPKPPDIPDSRPWIAHTLCVSDVPVLGLETGILIGEILHHYRGALDHLAWILVKRGSSKRLSARQQMNVAFPMARTREKYWNNINGKLPGVPHDQRTVIERYQPYRRSTTGRAIKYLRNLSDIDKHRLIVPVFLFPGNLKFNIEHEGGDRIRTEWRVKSGVELKPGTEILRVVLAASAPKPKVRMKGTLGAASCFLPSMARPAPGFTALNVTYVLDNIKNICTEILSQFKIRP